MSFRVMFYIISSFVLNRGHSRGTTQTSVANLPDYKDDNHHNHDDKPQYSYYIPYNQSCVDILTCIIDKSIEIA